MKTWPLKYTPYSLRAADLFFFYTHELPAGHANMCKVN